MPHGTWPQQRAAMVEQQLVARGISDARVLDAMRAVPREAFVPEAQAQFAYDDGPLPIEAGQTISQPYIVGLMLEAAAIRAGDRALEIGLGSGYAAALLSRLAATVHAIERHAELAERAAARLAWLGAGNVTIHIGDGSSGWPEAAPFDAILVAAACPAIPEPLRDQLAIGGRLVLPVGDAAEQRLLRITRRIGGDFVREDLGGVRFVPLVGAHGWQVDA